MPARFLAAAVLAFAGNAAAQLDPYEGKPGKDVMWVPSRPAVIETMLDLARVTPNDLVVDLGSGDGRIVIAAAKRGSRALGVEYEADMVALARRNATEQGVADRATFVQGDMFEADLSGATVLALFLLPENLKRLAPKFAQLAPGTRIVSNTYRIEGWKETGGVEIGGDCELWCTAYLYIVGLANFPPSAVVP